MIKYQLPLSVPTSKYFNTPTISRKVKVINRMMFNYFYIHIYDHTTVMIIILVQLILISRDMSWCNFVMYKYATLNYSALVQLIKQNSAVEIWMHFNVA